MYWKRGIREKNTKDARQKSDGYCLIEHKYTQYVESNKSFCYLYVLFQSDLELFLAITLFFCPPEILHNALELRHDFRSRSRLITS